MSAVLRLRLCADCFFIVIKDGDVSDDMKCSYLTVVCFIDGR